GDVTKVLSTGYSVLGIPRRVSHAWGEAIGRRGDARVGLATESGRAAGVGPSPAGRANGVHQPGVVQPARAPGRPRPGGVEGVEVLRQVAGRAAGGSVDLPGDGPADEEPLQ